MRLARKTKVSRAFAEGSNKLMRDNYLLAWHLQSMRGLLQCAGRSWDGAFNGVGQPSTGRAAMEGALRAEGPRQ